MIVAFKVWKSWAYTNNYEDLLDSFEIIFRSKYLKRILFGIKWLSQKCSPIDFEHCSTIPKSDMWVNASGNFQ